MQGTFNYFIYNYEGINISEEHIASTFKVQPLIFIVEYKFKHII
jgi:hypothetical protein